MLRFFVKSALQHTRYPSVVRAATAALDLHKWQRFQSSAPKDYIGELIAEKPRLKEAMVRENIAMHDVAECGYGHLLEWNSIKTGDKNKYMTFKQYVVLPYLVRDRLLRLFQQKAFIKALDNRYITIDQVILLLQKEKYLSPLFQDLFVSEVLDTGKIILSDYLPHRIDFLLELARVFIQHSVEKIPYIANALGKHTTTNKIVSLSYEQLQDLNELFGYFDPVAWIETGYFTLDEFLLCRHEDRSGFYWLLFGLEQDKAYAEMRGINQTPKITLKDFLSLEPRIRKELPRSSISMWFHEFTIEQFFALPKSDQMSLRCILFTNLGKMALLKKQITIQEFLEMSQEERKALSHLFREEDPIYGGFKHKTESNDRLFDSGLFDFKTFANVPENKRFDFIRRVEEQITEIEENKLTKRP